MKKLIVAVMLIVSGSAFADGYYGHHGYEGYRGGYHGGGGNWVAPAIIGGIIGYNMAPRYNPPVYASPPVYVSPPVVYSNPPLYGTPGPNYIGANGAPYGYHWETLTDANCNCPRSVIVPN